jgi:hypothetical protein
MEFLICPNPEWYIPQKSNGSRFVVLNSTTLVHIEDAGGDNETDENISLQPHGVRFSL